jgi:hypothetical protein
MKTKKIQNEAMRNQRLRYKPYIDSNRMQEAQCDDLGIVELPEDVADELLGTPGWHPPVKRDPGRRVAPRRRAPRPRKPEPDPEPVSEPEEPQKAQEGEETPDSEESEGETETEEVEEETEGEEPEGETEEEEEEVPPYEEWDYQDLLGEARKRMDDDPTFTAPESKKQRDVIKALYFDDQRNS